jgi:hypothetical protein
MPSVTRPFRPIRTERDCGGDRHGDGLRLVRLHPVGAVRGRASERAVPDLPQRSSAEHGTQRDTRRSPAAPVSRRSRRDPGSRPPGSVDLSGRLYISDPVRDQPIVRTGLTMLLDAQPDIDVIDAAADGREAVRQAPQLRPDIGLFDIRFATDGGHEATRRLDEYVQGALRAGAPADSYSRTPDPPADPGDPARRRR